MNKKIPMRQCVGCRNMKPKRELIRIIRTSEEEIQVDTTGKKNGRGAYICPERRSLKMAVPKEIYEDFEKEMGKLDQG